MVYLKPYFIRHVLSAHLASVIVSPHDLLPEFRRHKPALILIMIIAQIAFIVNFLQLPIPV